MRVTESRMLKQAAYAIERERSNIAKAGQELSSGVRVAKPSDDPAAWAEGARARVRRTESSASGNAMGRARGQLLETDTALDAINTGLRDGLANAIQFANASYNAQDRANAVITITALRDQLIDAANTISSDGEYVFGGSDRTTAPFDPAGSYVGDTVRRSIQLSPGGSEQVTLSGDALTAASGIDVIGTIDRLATALGANDVAGIQTAITEITAASDQVASARAEVGSRIFGLDKADQARQNLELDLNQAEIDAIGADAVDSALRLAQGQRALEGSRTVAERIVSMLG